MPTSPVERRSIVNALVVNELGEGAVVELMVSLRPGQGQVLSPTNLDRSAAQASQLAGIAALGAELPHWELRWDLSTPNGDRVLIEGSSLGLAVAAGALAALRGVPVPSGWAFTGSVAQDGTLERVDDLPAKMRAAGAAGLKQVAAPWANKGAEHKAPPGLSLVPLHHLRELELALGLPRPRVWTSAPRLALGGLLLMVPLGLLAWQLATPTPARELVLSFPELSSPLTLPERTPGGPLPLRLNVTRGSLLLLLRLQDGSVSTRPLYDPSQALPSAQTLALEPSWRSATLIWTANRMPPQGELINVMNRSPESTDPSLAEWATAFEGASVRVMTLHPGDTVEPEAEGAAVLVITLRLR